MSKTFEHWTDPMGRITEEGRARMRGIGAIYVKPAAKVAIGEVEQFFDELYAKALGEGSQSVSRKQRLAKAEENSDAKSQD